MNKWTERLRAVLPADCTGLRPFVCNGFPCQSEAIIIGKNPATKLHTNWWDFWSDEEGFGHGKFAAKYHKIRPEISQMRRNFDRIRDKCIACVETNVYCNELEKGHDEEGVPNQRVIELLLYNMPRLRAVIIFGAEAREAVNELPGIRDRLEVLKGQGVMHEALPIRASYDSIDKMCARIKANRLM